MLRLYKSRNVGFQNTSDSLVQGIMKILKCVISCYGRKEKSRYWIDFDSNRND